MRDSSAAELEPASRTQIYVDHEYAFFEAIAGGSVQKLDGHSWKA